MTTDKRPERLNVNGAACRVIANYRGGYIAVSSDACFARYNFETHDSNARQETATGHTCVYACLVAAQ